MISNEVLKKKILENAFSGKLVSKKSIWESKSIDEVLKTIPVKSYQINQTEINPIGKYPVVSQSKELIEGYSDEESKLLDLYDEYIIFGDHSKTVKYINFPFIVGADGTKVFSSLENNVKYLYYHMLYNSYFIKSSGYTRNYKYLKEFKYNIPSREEQDLIANKIDELFDLVEKKELNNIEKEKLKELLKSKILDSGLNATLINNDSSLNSVDIEEIVDDVPFKIPSNWKWCNLKKCCDKLYAGGDKTSRFSKDKTDEYQIPVVANGVTNDGIIGYTDVPTETDTCMTLSGRGTIGDTSIRNYPFSPVVSLITIKPNSFIDIKYLKYVMSYLTESSKGTSIQQLTIPMIKNKLIPVPPLEEQKRIVEKIESLFELIEQL